MNLKLEQTRKAFYRKDFDKKKEEMVKLTTNPNNTNKIKFYNLPIMDKLILYPHARYSMNTKQEHIFIENILQKESDIEIGEQIKIDSLKDEHTRVGTTPEVNWI